MSIQNEYVEIFRKQTLHATITRACQNCGAGGDGNSHFEPWTCHICYSQRPADETSDGKQASINSNNVIWQKVWRSPTIWQQIVNLLTTWRK